MKLFICIFQGAPEEVLKLCNRILLDGHEYPLGNPQDQNPWRNQVEKAIQTLGSLGERVIGITLL
jgi:hypothetical protein